jgi:hypothetical protein
VAPKADPSNCIQNASVSGNITVQSSANDPTVSTLSRDLTVTTAGSYTFTFGDVQFPVALATPPTLALFQGAGIVGLGFPSGTVFALSPGTYQLKAIAQADQTVKAGLYAITIAGPAGTSPLFDDAVPVGLLNAAAPFMNPSAQSVTLAVNDFGFPGPVTSASALLTAGGTVLGTASAAGGAASFAAPAGTLTLWSYGSQGATAGTYGIDVAGTSDLYTTALAVGPSGSTYTFAFVTPAVAAGAYQATAADLQFPSQLTALSFAVAQNGVILQQSTTAASLNINAAAGPVVLLVSAQAPASGGTSGNGLFDVNLQTTGASPELVYDKTQVVSSMPALFDSQSLTLGVSASFTAALTDLQVPAQFDSLALVVSRGTQILGKIYGGGSFDFSGSPGTYQLTFVATPAAMQQFGLYGVSVVNSPPIISLKSNVSSAETNSLVTLSWSATNAVSCTASGGNWVGSKSTSASSESVVLAATTTYTLTCTGGGGTASQSVMVTATAKSSGGGGGGGSLDPGLLGLGAALAGLRLRRRLQGSCNVR